MVRCEILLQWIFSPVTSTECHRVSLKKTDRILCHFFPKIFVCPHHKHGPASSFGETRENAMDTFRTMAVAGMRFAFLRGAKEHVRDLIARVVILIL